MPIAHLFLGSSAFVTNLNLGSLANLICSCYGLLWSPFLL